MEAGAALLVVIAGGAHLTRAPEKVNTVPSFDDILLGTIGETFNDALDNTLHDTLNATPNDTLDKTHLSI